MRELEAEIGFCALAAAGVGAPVGWGGAKAGAVFSLVRRGEDGVVRETVVEVFEGRICGAVWEVREGGVVLVAIGEVAR